LNGPDYQSGRQDFTLQAADCGAATFSYGSTNATATCNGTTGTITATDIYTASDTDKGTHAIWLDGTDTNLLIQFQTVAGTHSDSHSYPNVRAGSHKVEFLDPNGHETDKTVVVCPTATTSPTPTHTGTPTTPCCDTVSVTPTGTTQGLANTGARTGSLLAVGIGLLGAGCGMLLIGRRRVATGRHR
jgi:hypothetical protein